MGEALAEARQAAGRGRPAVGAIAVMNDAMVARGSNRVAEGSDPTAHAVMAALREAARKLGTVSLHDVTIFTTLEPCPMCVGAMLECEVAGLVYAAPNPVERLGRHRPPARRGPAPRPPVRRRLGDPARRGRGADGHPGRSRLRGLTPLSARGAGAGVAASSATASSSAIASPSAMSSSARATPSGPSRARPGRAGAGPGRARASRPSRGRGGTSPRRAWRRARAPTRRSGRSPPCRAHGPAPTRCRVRRTAGGTAGGSPSCASRSPARHATADSSVRVSPTWSSAPRSRNVSRSSCNAGRGRLVVAGQEDADRERLAGARGRFRVACQREQVERVLLVPPELVGAALDEGDEPEVVMGLGHDGGITGRLGERQALLIGAARGGEVVEPVGEAAEGRQPRHAHPRGPTVPAAPGALRAAHGPRAAGPAGGTSARRRSRSEPRLGLPVRERPVDGGPEVAILRFQPREPGERIRPEHPGPGRGGDLGAQRDEPPLDGLPLAGLLEPLERVLAQQRVQAEAGLAARRVSTRTRLLSTSDSRPSSASIPRPPSGPRPRARPRRPAAREHAQPGEQAALLRRQEVVAPRDGAAEGPLPFGRSRAPPPRSRLRCQPIEDLRRREQPDARGGELEGQRAARPAGPRSPAPRPSRRRRGRGPGARPVHDR